MKLKDVMKADFPVLYLEQSLEEAWEYFRSNPVDFAPVVDAEGGCVGVLLRADLLALPLAGGDIMPYLNSGYGVFQETEDLIYLISSGLYSVREPLVVTDAQGKYAGAVFPPQMLGALEQITRLYEAILNCANDGILAVDADMQIVFINKEFRRIHNVEHKQLLGESVLDMFPETMLSTALNSNQNIPYSNSRHFNHTGATVLASYRLMYDMYSQKLGSMAIIKDFSETNELAINLRETKTMSRLFSSIFEGLSEMAFAVDRENQITYANQTWTAFFSQKAGDMLRISEIKSITDSVFADPQALGRENEIAVREHRSKTAYIEISSIPLTDVNNELVGILCLMKDVTSIKKLRNKVAQSKELLDFYENQLLNKNLREHLVCANPQFKKVLATALHVAKLNVTVLIEGENGVGKDLVAKLIHSNSPRSQKPFIPVNCGAIPESLWESEMFGYEEGAFTGAKKGGKRGMMELAHGGTLFLDEIGSMPLAAQVKLLRVIQNMEITKVGTEEIKKIDIRILVASNRSLEQMVREGTFREDLYYRLNVIHLVIPPLRERPDEIVMLAQRFVDDCNKKYGKEVSLTSEAAKVLEVQDWPGNVRQLKNVIEYGVVMCEDELLPFHLPQNMFPSSDNQSNHQGSPYDIPKQIRQLERSAIKRALEKTRNNKSEAIKMLNISRKTFYKKLKEYELEQEED